MNNLPEASDITSLTVDGETLEIVTAPGVKDRGRYVWVQSMSAVLGGVPVFGGMYPWVAEHPPFRDLNVGGVPMGRSP